MFNDILTRINRRWLSSLVQRRVRHGIDLSLYIEFAPLDKNDLWRKLEEALDLIAVYRPIWIRRIVALQNSIHVRRIPGVRAMQDGRYTFLDPYLLANFASSQVAASIIHETMHAAVRARGFPYNPEAPGREEKACRAAELRFGHVLLRAGVPEAEAVIQRARETLDATDEAAGVVIDREELRAIQLITRLKDVPLPMWWKRRQARRWGILNSPHWKRLMDA